MPKKQSHSVERQPVSSLGDIVPGVPMPHWQRGRYDRKAVAARRSGHHSAKATRGQRSLGHHAANLTRLGIIVTAAIVVGALVIGWLWRPENVIGVIAFGIAGPGAVLMVLVACRFTVRRLGRKKMARRPRGGKASRPGPLVPYYSPQTKAEAVRRYRTGAPETEIAEDFGCTVRMLRLWVRLADSKTK